MSLNNAVKLEHDVTVKTEGNIDTGTKINNNNGNSSNGNTQQENLDLDLSRAGRNVWLVRLPRFLADRWKNTDQLSGQELGKVQIKQPVGGHPLKVKLALNDTPSAKDIPHDYEISLTKTKVDNTFVFTESNLERYQKVRTELVNLPETTTDEDVKPSEASTSNNYNNNNNNNSNNYKSSSYKNNYKGRDKVVPYVKTIPKKTALVGTVCHECQVIPSITDPNYKTVISRRKQIVQRAPRPKVTLLNELPGVTSSIAGPSLKGSNSMFLQSRREGAAKKAEGRAIRIPQNELLDLLFRLFDEYDYWTIKGLKERTKQPESYLKETVDSIAILNKKGPYALKWSLKPEYKKLKDVDRANAVKKLDNSYDGAAAEGTSNVNDDDDDEEVEMIDVI